MVTVKIEIVFEEESCITCGIFFAIPEHYRRWLEEKHKTFYCPNGHAMHYLQETEAEKLRIQLSREQESASELRTENYRLVKQRDGTLDRLAKLKKRVNAGVCPHCRRHFVNVERHIQTKHQGSPKR